MKVTRHVTHRDGGLEGDLEAEPDAGDVAKEAQRDLTSLSRPPPEHHP